MAIIQVTSAHSADKIDLDTDDIYEISVYESKSPYTIIDTFSDTICVKESAADLFNLAYDSGSRKAFWLMEP